MVPLVFGGRDVGLLELYRRHALPWSSAEIERAQLLAHQLAAVIDLLERIAAAAEPPHSGSRWRSWSTSCASTPDASLPFRSWCHMATDGASRSCTPSPRGWASGARGSRATTTTCRRTGARRRWRWGRRRSATGELLLRMTGPRGERARRRSLAPARRRLAARRRGAGGAALSGGGARRDRRAARGGEVDARRARRRARGCRCSIPTRCWPGDGGEWGDALRTWRAELAAALATGSGAVAVTTALREGHRLGDDQGGRRGGRGGASGAASTRRRRSAGTAGPRRAPSASATGCSSTSCASGRRSGCRSRMARLQGVSRR